MAINESYQFFFVGGSGGSFTKIIFYYYLYKLGKFDKVSLDGINYTTGDCHNNRLPTHYHFYNLLDLSGNIIKIDFDKDDIPIIIEMVYEKHFRNAINKDHNILKHAWDGLLADVDPTDHEIIKNIFKKQSHLLVDPKWNNYNLNPVLILTFKEIMYGDINFKITNFLNTIPLPEVDQFIKKYRLSNKKYLDKTIS